MSANAHGNLSFATIADHPDPRVEVIALWTRLGAAHATAGTKPHRPLRHSPYRLGLSEQRTATEVAIVARPMLRALVCFVVAAGMVLGVIYSVLGGKVL